MDILILHYLFQKTSLNLSDIRAALKDDGDADTYKLKNNN